MCNHYTNITNTYYILLNTYLLQLVFIVMNLLSSPPTQTQSGVQLYISIRDLDMCITTCSLWLLYNSSICDISHDCTRTSISQNPCTLTVCVGITPVLLDTNFMVTFTFSVKETRLLDIHLLTSNVITALSSLVYNVRTHVLFYCCFI